MKRLKIVEQIIIVLVFAVLIPFVTIGIIISNISQQSVRNELANNTSLIAEFIGDTLENYLKLSQYQLDQMVVGFNRINGSIQKIQYFNEIESKTKLFKNLDIIESSQIPQEKYISENESFILTSPIDSQKKYYLTAEVKVNVIDELLDDKTLKGRNIYVFNSDNQDLITKSANAGNPDGIMAGFVSSDTKKQGFFGENKNTPKAYYKLNYPNWLVVVDTTTKVTANTITKARYRIILALSLAALSIFIPVGLYTFYLYVNIRQLFKGITAISKGNYDKKIHLIKRIFTPHEIVFLAKEFNYMTNKINVSYKDLKKKNKELKKLNEFRENLVNATSHEFRTPLTSIIGYTSRLLRQDITLDDETKVKSLKIIKQQAQRLSGMVEDLLVIPELESYSLKFNIQETSLSDSIINATDYLQDENIEFKTNISDDLGYVWADDYRLEQILINLIDNAKKYTTDNIIQIEAKNVDKHPTVIIKNKCNEIPDEIKEKLFDKFIRADSNMTRTTRGTGLGLYIVKGLCEAMKIDISLECSEYFIITLKFNDYVQ